MISSYAQNGLPFLIFDLFLQMLVFWRCVDDHIFLGATKACGMIGRFDGGGLVHYFCRANGNA